MESLSTQPQKTHTANTSRLALPGQKVNPGDCRPQKDIELVCSLTRVVKSAGVARSVSPDRVLRRYFRSYVKHAAQVERHRWRRPRLEKTSRATPHYITPHSNTASPTGCTSEFNETLSPCRGFSNQVSLYNSQTRCRSTTALQHRCENVVVGNINVCRLLGAGCRSCEKGHHITTEVC